MTLEEGIADLHALGWSVTFGASRTLIVRHGQGASTTEYNRRVPVGESWEKALARLKARVESEA